MKGVKKETVYMRLVMPVLIMTSVLFATPAHDYVKAFNLATKFYGAQRCGDTKSWIHGACHTGDGSNLSIDLSGGWHDCGDHVKFGQTNAYAAALLLLMYNRFPDIYKKYGDTYSQDFSSGNPDSIPDVLNEVKIFTDWLLKACQNGKVYYQISSANTDHNNCAEPAYQSTLGTSVGGNPRKVFSTDATGSNPGATNFCGSAAAALALMYMSYKEFDENYANQCLQKAKEYYVIANKKRASIASQDGTAYDADYWADDLAFGAIELYRATKEKAYGDTARALHDLSDTVYCMPTYFFMEYGNCTPVVNYELYMEYPASIYRSELGSEIKIIIDSTKNSMKNFGYAHFDTHTEEWASLKYAATGAMEAFLYHNLTKDTAAYNFGKKNIDFILGSHKFLCTDAPANFSFLIGYNVLGGGSPKQPHHCSAFGRTSDATWEAFNNVSVANKNELPGALVGGPKAPGSGYIDARKDPVTNEVGIYYNAPLVGALAYIIKMESTAIKYSVLPNKLSTLNPNASMKLAGNYLVSIAQGANAFKNLYVYSAQGRLIGTIPVRGRTLINVKGELGIGTELLIIKAR